MLKIAFVDPFVSPEEISFGLRKYGILSVGIFQRCHLQSSELKNRFKPHLFDEVIFIEQHESIEAMVEKIKSHHIDYIFNGFDISSPLTDQLTHQLYPEVANNVKTSLCRFDKLAVQDRLRRAGLKTMSYLEVHGTTLSLKEEHLLAHWNFPVILKPTNASGTLGFFECKNLLELQSNLQKKISSHYGYAVNSYLLQEKLIGDEYVIDTFSWKGQHHLIHIRRYTKEYFNGVPIPTMSHTVLPLDPLWEEISDYFYQVLDILGFKNGLCHAEIFLTAHGFFLIDLNPRLPGANNASCLLAKETYGYSHMDVLAHVILNKPLNAYNYSFGRMIYLQNLLTHIINPLNVDKINKLPSFKNCISNNKEGMSMSLPKKLQDTIAFVILAHKDLAQIEEDTKKIFCLERNHELF
ncbi:MAG: ATP-grasp domain-containing protein [Candidatus Aquirickettsiella sp.]